MQHRYKYVLTDSRARGKIGLVAGDGGGERCPNLNEKHSHLGTLAGARVPGSAGLVKCFLQIFFLTSAWSCAYEFVKSQAQKSPDCQAIGAKN